MTLSKNKIKYVNSFSLKKNRDTYGLFVAEGDKITADFLRFCLCECLIATGEWLSAHAALVASAAVDDVVAADSREEMGRVSQLTSPPSALGVFRKPEYEPFGLAGARTSLILALDSVQDPGNLGTIVRTAAWFGVADVLCSHGCADIYGPKAVQATMGALASVRVHYVDLPHTLRQCRLFGAEIYGTFLDGLDIYTERIAPRGVIVMGNEGGGISDAVAVHVTRRLLIPQFGDGAAESLNVSVATAVVCSEFRRRG